MLETDPTTAQSESREASPTQAPGTLPGVKTDPRFWVGVASAVAFGGTVRFAYLYHGAPALVASDGLTYHLEALRIADGLGYTSPIGDIGAEWAWHAPGWVTLLAGVTEAGGHSLRSHQVTGLVIGLGVIVVTGLVGRRYAGRRVGVAAAILAAAYPGFWVLDVQIISEPLGLLLGGLLMLVLADLWDRPTLARALLAGAVTGGLALIRSEQLALLVIGVAPILLLNRRITGQRRLVWTGAATLTALVLMAPWTIHNLGRFEEPVVLSTNLGPTLLAGNCPPTYKGELIGSYDILCIIALNMRTPDLDWSQRDIHSRRVALENMRDSVDRLPATVLARYGRTLGVFRPAQTVGFAAGWLGSATWPVWAWVTSFWVVAALAAYGSVLLRRSRGFQWPLVAPLLITLLVVTVAYGEPRYHTPADLGLVVLATVGLDRLVLRPRSAPTGSARSADQRPGGVAVHV